MSNFMIVACSSRSQDMATDTLQKIPGLIGLTGLTTKLPKVIKHFIRNSTVYLFWTF